MRYWRWSPWGWWFRRRDHKRAIAALTPAFREHLLPVFIDEIYRVNALWERLGQVMADHIADEPDE